MSVYWLWTFVYMVTTASADSRVYNETSVSALISSLQRERWNDDPPCQEAAINMLRAVENNTLWAVWMWDSMQPPVGSMLGTTAHLGSFDQCLSFPWSSSHPHLEPQYCLVDVKSPAREQTKDFGPFDSADEYYETPNPKSSRRYNVHVGGVCVPATCKTAGVRRLAQRVLAHTHLPGHVTVDHRDCQTASDLNTYSNSFYIFWYIIGALVTTCILSTCLTDYITGYFDQVVGFLSWRLVQVDTTVVPDIPPPSSNVQALLYSGFPALKMEKLLVYETKHLMSQGVITKSFCLKRNFSGLSILKSNDIEMLNGGRVITAISLAVLHDGYYLIKAPIANPLQLDLERTVSTAEGKIMLNLAALSVDVFFGISGLLLIRGFMLGRGNLLIGLLKRYIRFIGSFAIIILYITTAVSDTGTGPLWRRNNRDEVTTCRQYWWKSLLMINNDVGTVCHIITWQIAVDYQLSILGTIIFFVYSKSRALGVTAFSMVATAMTLYLGYDIYKRELPYIAFQNLAFTNFRSYKELEYHYYKIYCHAGPYAVGVVMGYIMTKYQPREHRHVFNKGQSVAVFLLSISLLVGTLVSVAFLDGYHPLLAAVVVVTNRVLWTVGALGIIVSGEYGDLRSVKSLFAWSGFTPLSKLCYGIYLTHTFFIQQDKFPGRALMVHSKLNQFRNGFGVFAFSCAVSLVLYLIVEAPFVNLTNSLLDNKSPAVENGVTHQKGKAKAS